MESSIVEIHQYFYIPDINKLAFHLPHVRIIETRHCGNTRQEAFKSHSAFQGVLINSDYADCLVPIFSHKTKSE